MRRNTAPTSNSIASFRDSVWSYYCEFGRDYPWRRAHDPYRIILSEVMLQQTQTHRALPKYQEFLRLFPTVFALANASPATVITCWQGLGYNRRAIALHNLARCVVSDFRGRIPTTVEELKSLPGIGEYSARAIALFAFNQCLPFIETNIRTVFLYHFFEGQDGVADRQILPLVESTCDRRDARNWFYALMDYGAALKTIDRTISHQSAHFVRQTRFEGSARQRRGRVLRALSLHGQQTVAQLAKSSAVNRVELRGLLRALQAEGFLSSHDGHWLLRQ